jgi:hypothetical protein
LGRVINPNGVGKERTRLTRAIVLALRELYNQQEPDEETRDLVAFIAMALGAVAETIDQTVTPWEKRGYWLKADRFRMEWDWAGIKGQVLKTALEQEDWGKIAITAGQVTQKLKDVKVPKRHRLGKPWVGAWGKLQEQR